MYDVYCNINMYYVRYLFLFYEFLYEKEDKEIIIFFFVLIRERFLGSRAGVGSVWGKRKEVIDEFGLKIEWIEKNIEFREVEEKRLKKKFIWINSTE